MTYMSTLPTFVMSLSSSSPVASVWTELLELFFFTFIYMETCNWPQQATREDLLQ